MVRWFVATRTSSSLLVSHLAFLLDGQLPLSPVLLALVLVAGLGGHAGQVRVVDPRHALRLLGGRASGRKDVQRDARLNGHADLLWLRMKKCNNNKKNNNQSNSSVKVLTVQDLCILGTV